MNDDVRNLVILETYANGIVVMQSFYDGADKYIARYFTNKTANEKLIIESYLTQAAVRIAKSEGKARLEGDDFKAAVWLYHLPEQPDDPCIRAGENALILEGKRKANQRGYLLEAFAKKLDQKIIKPYERPY